MFICVEYVTSNALMNVFVVTYVIHGITSFACRLMGMKRSLMMIGTVILVKMHKNCLYLKPCSFIYDSGLWSYSQMNEDKSLSCLYCKNMQIRLVCKNMQIRLVCSCSSLIYHIKIMISEIFSLHSTFEMTCMQNPINSDFFLLLIMLNLHPYS